MMDANGDGVEDLILGRDGNINAIWTMKDGKPLDSLEAGHRVTFVKDIFLSGQLWRMDLITAATEIL